MSVNFDWKSVAEGIPLLSLLHVSAWTTSENGAGWLAHIHPRLNPKLAALPLAAAAIKHSRLPQSENFFSLPPHAFCVFLIEHVALLLRLLLLLLLLVFYISSQASSQLCGAIDFNIIDFLCHYPTARFPLFSLLASFFFFGAGFSRSAQRNVLCIGMEQQRKKA